VQSPWLCLRKANNSLSQCHYTIFFFCSDVFRANKLECLYLGKPSKTSTISQQYTKQGPKGANTLAYFVGASVPRKKSFFTLTPGRWDGDIDDKLCGAPSPRTGSAQKKKEEIMLNWTIFKFAWKDLEVIVIL
jgi:hypothetical protein